MSMLRTALLVFATLASTWALGATTTTVVDVPTRGVTQRFLYVHPDGPVANIVLLSGGDGYLGIRDDGTMTGVAGRCGPVARNRDAFAARGFGVALVDRTSDFHVWQYADVLEVVRYVRGRDNVPTWIIGGSSSTGPVLDFAVDLPPEQPLGVVVFSPDRVNAADAALVKRPTGLVYHSGDPYQHAPALFAALTSAPVKQSIGLSGGSNADCGCSITTS
jgi:hypothetical protein